MQSIKSSMLRMKPASTQATTPLVPPELISFWMMINSEGETNYELVKRCNRIIGPTEFSTMKYSIKDALS